MNDPRYAKPDKIKVPISVGELLDKWRTGQNLSISALARKSNINHAHMSRILSNQVGITPNMAIWIERATGLTALRLLLTQVKYDLAKARYHLVVSSLHGPNGEGSDSTESAI